MNITFQWFSVGRSTFKTDNIGQEETKLKQNGGYILFSFAKEDAETRNLSITRISGEKKALKTWRPVDVLPWPAYDPFFSRRKPCKWT